VTRDPDAILRHQPAGAGIPRVLHQVYLGRPLPPDLASVVARVREVNPTWEHRLYDDARMTEYVTTHCSATSSSTARAASTSTSRA
jgi:mannosyltransferase OCH1-like enzyme